MGTKVKATKVDYAALLVKCNAILDSANLTGVINGAALSSVVGNRKIKFLALHENGEKIDTRPADGSILVSVDGKSTRQGFKDYWEKVFSGEALYAEKLLAHWLILLADGGGNQIGLIAPLVNEFLSAGVRVPRNFAKYTDITVKGIVVRTEKEVFSRETLLAETAAALEYTEHLKAWIKASPTRSSKYGLTGKKPVKETVELQPIAIEQASPEDLKEFEI